MADDGQSRTRTDGAVEGVEVDAEACVRRPTESPDPVSERGRNEAERFVGGRFDEHVAAGRGVVQHGRTREPGGEARTARHGVDA